MRRILIFTAEGPRSVDDRDVLFVYRDNTVGGYCNATLVMVVDGSGKRAASSCRMTKGFFTRYSPRKGARYTNRR